MFDPKTLSLEEIVNRMVIAVMRDDLKLLQHLCETAHTQFDVSVNTRYVSKLKTEPLETAIEYDRKEMFEYLLPYSSFTSDAFHSTTPIDVCLRRHNTNFAAQLIPYYSSNDLQKYFIRAAEENMWSIVDLISKHMNEDATQYQNVLLWASASGNQEAFERYYTFDRAQKAWERVELSWNQNHSGDDDLGQFEPEDIEMLVEHHQLQVFRNKLQESVSANTNTQQRKAKI